MVASLNTLALPWTLFPKIEILPTFSTSSGNKMVENKINTAPIQISHIQLIFLLAYWNRKKQFSSCMGETWLALSVISLHIASHCKRTCSQTIWNLPIKYPRPIDCCFQILPIPPITNYIWLFHWILWLYHVLYFQKSKFYRLFRLLQVTKWLKIK